jgi:hypothetical protein
MRKMTYGAWLSIVVFVAVAMGCASSGAGTQTALAPGDMASLAGTWDGTFTPPSGGFQPGTLTISPNGEYVARAGAFAATGKAQVKDGALMMTSTNTSGGIAVDQRTSTARLSRRADGVQVLSGSGHSDAGPFNFEVTRQK